MSFLAIKEILLNFNSASNYKFVIDPLDGTANYLSGNLEIKQLLSEKYFEEYNEEMPDNSSKFGTCISLTKDNIPIYTVIHYPKLNETLWSVKESSTFIEGKKINIPEKKEHEFNDAIRISQYSKINKFKHFFTNRKSYQSSSYNLRALLNGEILAYCTDRIDYLDFCPTLLAFIEAGGFLGDENANAINIENLIKKIDENGRLNQFMILCRPTLRKKGKLWLMK